ncbi:BatA [Hydrogenimonas sp.]|nr:BatA [Hydrogenimonas sp.]
MILLPCLWRCRRADISLYFPRPDLVSGSPFYKDPGIWRDALIYFMLVSALASPYLYRLSAAHERSGRDLVLVLDASGSMAESGFDRNEPDKRKFDVVKSIVSDFIKRRYDDNIGVVVFGTFAFTASPVTYDLNSLNQILDMVDVGIAGQNTAIGEGIAQAVRSLGFGHAKEKMIILLTDGRHNSGSVSPAEAVEEAKKKGVKIYAVGIGKKGEFDEEILKRAANESGGKIFSAIDAEALKSVYKTIDGLEPSPLRSEDRTERRPLYIYPLLVALALLGGRVYFVSAYPWRRS